MRRLKQKLMCLEILTTLVYSCSIMRPNMALHSHVLGLMHSSIKVDDVEESFAIKKQGRSAAGVKCVISKEPEKGASL